MESSANELLASTGKRTASDPYQFYLSFAEFPEVVEPTLTSFQGVIHAKPPMLELPKRIEYLRDDATPDGGKLEVLWQQVTREVLAGGRVSLLCAVAEADDRVRLVLYGAESLINWRLKAVREGGDPAFVVLQEIRRVPDEEDEFESDEGVFYRDGAYQSRLWAAEDRDADPEIVEPFAPVQVVGRSFDKIPIVTINALDAGYRYSAIPILPLVRRALSIYRLTADYRRALYNKGDPQAYISGISSEDAPTKIGGGALWTFEQPDARPGYLDIDGQGIPLMRQAIEDETRKYDEESGRLLSAGMRQESGEALRQRLSSSQMTIRNVVINCAAAFEAALKKVAESYGADPGDVSFKPSLDFTKPVMAGKDLLELAHAQQMGAPISSETIHEQMRLGDLTTFSFDEEMDLIQGSPASLLSLEPKPGKEEASDGGDGE